MLKVSIVVVYLFILLVATISDDSIIDFDDSDAIAEVYNLILYIFSILVMNKIMQIIEIQRNEEEQERLLENQIKNEIESARYAEKAAVDNEINKPKESDRPKSSMPRLNSKVGLKEFNQFDLKPKTSEYKPKDDIFTNDAKNNQNYNVNNHFKQSPNKEGKISNNKNNRFQDLENKISKEIRNKLSEDVMIKSNKEQIKAYNFARNKISRRLARPVETILKFCQRNIPDLYSVLGIHKSANEETIKKAYKKNALIIHPGIIII